MSHLPHYWFPIQVTWREVWFGKRGTRDVVPPLLPMFCITLGKSASSLGLKFLIWKTNFENLVLSHFEINDFSLTFLGWGKKNSAHSMECKG